MDHAQYRETPQAISGVSVREFGYGGHIYIRSLFRLSLLEKDLTKAARANKRTEEAQKMRESLVIVEP